MWFAWHSPGGALGRQQTHVKSRAPVGEFHVLPGAKAHLYTKPVRLDDCSLIPWHTSIPRGGAVAATPARSSVEQPTSLRLKFNAAGEPLRIMPNPASSEVLVIAQPEGGLLSIVDDLGQQVFARYTSSDCTSISVSRLPNGLFTLHYTTSTCTRSAPFIVQH